MNFPMKEFNRNDQDKEENLEDDQRGPKNKNDLKDNYIKRKKKESENEMSIKYENERKNEEKEKRKRIVSESEEEESRISRISIENKQMNGNERKKNNSQDELTNSIESEAENKKNEEKRIKLAYKSEDESSRKEEQYGIEELRVQDDLKNNNYTKKTQKTESKDETLIIYENECENDEKEKKKRRIPYEIEEGGSKEQEVVEKIEETSDETSQKANAEVIETLNKIKMESARLRKKNEQLLKYTTDLKNICRNAQEQSVRITINALLRRRIESLRNTETGDQFCQVQAIFRTLCNLFDINTIHGTKVREIYFYINRVRRRLRRTWNERRFRIIITSLAFVILILYFTSIFLN